MKQARSIFYSAISGNILEYYDFTVYAVFSNVIGRTFFTSHSEFLQVFYTLMVLAIGFLARPIGGILFGFIGDRFGRRITLIISMLGMTIPTFIMGLLPSYQEIGGIAPAVLITLRLIQGLCISGEGTGTAIFILEHNPNLQPGFITGLVQGSNIAGTLIASFIGIFIETYLSHITYAWRFAFLLGGFMGLIGFYLRLKVSETPIFIKLQEKKKTLKAPFIEVCKTSGIYMFITFGVGAVASSIVQLIKTYVNVFYRNNLHYENSVALSYLTYASFILMISMPFFGWITDKINKLYMLTLASAAIFLLSLPALMLMGASSFYLQILSLTLIGMLGGAIAGTAYIFVISLFTAEQRFSGVSFSYNLGIAIFGGTSPMISQWLVRLTGLYYAPAFYLMTTSLLFLVIVYYTKDLILHRFTQTLNA